LISIFDFCLVGISHFSISLLFFCFFFDLRSEVGGEGVSDDDIAELEENHCCCGVVSGSQEGRRGNGDLEKRETKKIFKKKWNTDQSNVFVIFPNTSQTILCVAGDVFCRWKFKRKKKVWENPFEKIEKKSNTERNYLNLAGGRQGELAAGVSGKRNRGSDASKPFHFRENVNEIFCFVFAFLLIRPISEGRARLPLWDVNSCSQSGGGAFRQPISAAEKCAIFSSPHKYPRT